MQDGQLMLGDCIEFARQLVAPYQTIYDAADHFVNAKAAKVIRHAAVGMICLMSRTGKLNNDKWKKLISWLRQKHLTLN